MKVLKFIPPGLETIIFSFHTKTLKFAHE